MKTYSELCGIGSYEDRLKYLKLDGRVGADTFGFDRFLNQAFYRSTEWKQIRDFVIARDMGYDLGSIDKPIYGRIMVHHMNPLTKEDVLNHSDSILDPEFLISVSHETHNLIHYGGTRKERNLVERKPNDTIPWKRK